MNCEQRKLDENDRVVFIDIENGEQGDHFGGRYKVYGEKYSGRRMENGTPIPCTIKLNQRVFHKVITNGKNDFFSFVNNCFHVKGIDPNFTVGDLWRKVKQL
jgi:hypothetical protein